MEVLTMHQRSNHELIDKEIVVKPFSLSVNQMYGFFGFKPQYVYNLINKGELIEGHHYWKLKKKVVIIYDRFIEWMQDQRYGG
jgi:hypothetical protein